MLLNGHLLIIPRFKWFGRYFPTSLTHTPIHRLASSMEKKTRMLPPSGRKFLPIDIMTRPAPSLCIVGPPHAGCMPAFHRRLAAVQ